jgi:hypothetical protein
MSEIKERTGADESREQGNQRWLVGGLAAAAVVIIAVVAFASRSPNSAPLLPLSDRQAATTWTQQNAQMWSWMQSHWDEMGLLHQHWGDVFWMQGHLKDYAWMQDHSGDMHWMHDHWSGMTWMHAQGMMGGGVSGGMMGQSGG